jgi:hypothetical protein
MTFARLGRKIEAKMQRRPAGQRALRPPGWRFLIRKLLPKQLASIIGSNRAIYEP